MSKLTQLKTIKAAGLRVPCFETVSWEAFRQNGSPATSLRFPLAVRSACSLEHGQQWSYAGAFRTELQVSREQLSTAIAQVFATYPEQEGQEVILQEMVAADYSGVLFAYRSGVWKVELTSGSVKGGVAGHSAVERILLPVFSRVDQYFSRIWLPWQPPGLSDLSLRRPLLNLSAGAARLLAADAAPLGLDIEFAICGGKVYFLRSRPITTPREAEQVLTSAHHQKLLPANPSPFMTGLIGSAGPALYDFFRQLDPRLPARSVMAEVGGMPWVNLSTLMDTLVAWGLPTHLVAHPAGAYDYYRLGWRPWRLLSSWRVLLRLRQEQKGMGSKIKDWVNKQRNKQRIYRLERVLLWQTDAPAAAEAWISDFRQFYIDLERQMQLLNVVVAGPLAVSGRWGGMRKVAHLKQRAMASTDYYQAFQALGEGRMSKASFLRNFGHRGFYESDIGQPRFREYTEQDWQDLLRGQLPADVPIDPAAQTGPAQVPFYLRRWWSLMYSRAWLRHMSMHFFERFRQEMQQQVAQKMGPDFSPWAYRPDDLLAILRGETWPKEMEAYPEPVGWGLGTFLANGYGRRLALDSVGAGATDGIGIYPGIVRGRVWRVPSTPLKQLPRPPYERVILVTDTLDPVWVPYFAQVDGVVAYFGGLLSDASIILREVGIPAITQLPARRDLPEGTWIEIDGCKGSVRVLSTPVSPESEFKRNLPDR